MYYAYILHSLVKDRYYIGHTSNLEKRLDQHNSGRTRSTSAYKPWKLVCFEKYETKSEAYKREREIKKYKAGY